MRERTFFRFSLLNEPVDERLAFIRVDVVILHGLSSSSPLSSSTPTEQAFGFFVGGTVVVLDFVIAFSVRVCPFPPTSGMVFEGSISATCKVSISILKSS
jgi:hypothetical protein